MVAKPLVSLWVGIIGTILAIGLYGIIRIVLEHAGVWEETRGLSYRDMAKVVGWATLALVVIWTFGWLVTTALLGV